MSDSNTGFVAFTLLSDAEKVDVLRFTGYPAYGWEGTYDPFGLYFAPYSIATPANPARMAAVLVLVRAKLAELYALDADVVSAAARLSTASAAVWTRNSNEIADRTSLLRQRGRELCRIMGVTPGPDIMGGQTVQLIV